jgi:hypothetical protein
MIVGVNTIDETRRARLEMLIKQHGGKLANLNEALGLERTHSQLSRIRNRNARKDRPGKFFEMGDDQAREIEIKLGLPTGWMDTPPTYAELHGEADFIRQALQIMEKMPVEQQKTALRLISALENPRIQGTESSFTLTTVVNEQPVQASHTLSLPNNETPDPEVKQPQTVNDGGMDLLDINFDFVIRELCSLPLDQHARLVKLVIFRHGFDKLDTEGMNRSLIAELRKLKLVDLQVALELAEKARSRKKQPPASGTRPGSKSPAISTKNSSTTIHKQTN